MVQRTENSTGTAFDDMGIYHGRPHVLVTQKFLDGQVRRSEVLKPRKVASSPQPGLSFVNRPVSRKR